MNETDMITPDDVWKKIAKAHNELGTALDELWRMYEKGKEKKRKENEKRKTL